MALEILQSLGLRTFNPSVTACPGCGRTTSTTFQELAKQIDDFLRAQMPVWKARYPGVENLKVAVMGCIVNGPGESKHADIGISLPGTGEAPAAPVFIDGEKALTLRGEGIAAEFHKIVEELHRTPLRRRARRIDATASRRPPTPGGQAHPRDPNHGRHTPATGHARPLRAVKGMNDILPPESARWEWFEDTVRALMRALRLPQHPHADRRADAAVRARPRRGHRHRREGDVLLHRQHERRRADAATREHRRRRARGGRALDALRRRQAAVLHRRRCSATSGRRRGRYRQFHQVGVEALGFAGPDVDAEVILMCRALWRELGLVSRRAAGTQQPGSAGRAPGPPRRADRALRGPRRPARRRGAAPPAQQPAAHPRHQEPGDAGAGGGGADS